MVDWQLLVYRYNGFVTKFVAQEIEDKQTDLICSVLTLMATLRRGRTSNILFSKYNGRSLTKISSEIQKTVYMTHNRMVIWVIS